MNSLSENNNTLITYKKNPFSPEVATPPDNGLQITINNDHSTNNNYETAIKEKAIKKVWTKESFKKNKNHKKGKSKLDLSLNLNTKTTWASDNKSDDFKTEQYEVKNEATKELPLSTPSTPDKEVSSPPHHARRPMNAFLIFCKKHRPVVRERYPNLENRGVTRILGEWWALLDEKDKCWYTDLAREYKDAFFSANPDFKWYKLPAPPLRTLSTRPANVQKMSPLSSPTQVTPPEAEFTPGKLADESQLGSITSLMNMSNNSSSTKLNISDNNNVTNVDMNSFVDSFQQNLLFDITKDPDCKFTPTAVPKVNDNSLPPKPIKKRIFDQLNDNKNVVRNIFQTNSLLPDSEPNDISHPITEEDNDETENFTNGCNDPKSNNMTKQDLLDKVVDSMFPEDTLPFVNLKRNGVNGKQKKETRKSGRLCKGKRYAEFMVEGKLLGNKRDKHLTQYKYNELNKTFENELINKFVNQKDAPKQSDLENTIKRLAERTQTKLDDINNQNFDLKVESRPRTFSENSDTDLNSNLNPSYFNLELRIAELPSLSYDAFLHRKRESKKRKSARIRHEAEEQKALKISDGSSLTGSKKRKNKNTITRLEKTVDPQVGSFSHDLYGLATLAEIAANTEKINAD